MFRSVNLKVSPQQLGDTLSVSQSESRRHFAYWLSFSAKIIDVNNALVLFLADLVFIARPATTRRGRSNVKRRGGENRIIWEQPECLKGVYFRGAGKARHGQHGNPHLGRNYPASPADKRRRYSSA